LVAFAAIHLESIGATATGRSLAIAGWVLGGFVGIGALERFVQRLGSRLFLLVAALLTVGDVSVLATSRSPGVAAGALFFVGLTGSTLHPLAKARAYAALPGRPAVVNAVASALLVFDIAAPLALGFVAVRSGSMWAIAGILVAPLGVAVASVFLDRKCAAVSPRP
jgi:hypothetical protein